jgi:TatD DNase family protein
MIGLHPCYVEPDPDPQLDALEAFIASEPNVVAIGEAGLDLYWDKTTLPQQIVALDRQLAWAKHYGLPIALHTREATAQTLDRIRAAQDGRLTGVLHCFSGSAAEARQALDLNFKLGIGGPITYSKTLPDALKGLPETALVLETDSPYLTPVPHRGKRNESAYLHLIAEAVQQRVWPHLGVQQTIDQTTANAQALFPVVARQLSAINTPGITV